MRLHSLAGLVLAPVLAFQGALVKVKIPRQRPPDGARSGVDGDGPPLSLLILGDSAGLGVGVATQEDALTGRTLAHLAPHYRVSWALGAGIGADTRDVLRWLRNAEPRPVDVVVTSLGVNDVVSPTVTLRAWRRRQAELRELLRERFQVRHTVLCGLPPVGAFPSLPQPLRWVLGERARCFSDALEEDSAADPRFSYLDLLFTDDPALMADDRFHPGPGINRIWGRKVAERIMEVFPPDP